MSERWQQRIDGYVAAFKEITAMMREAEKKRPLRHTLKDSKKAAFREGYYQGLVVAHCTKALGEFPDHNKEAIKKALSRP